MFACVVHVSLIQLMFGLCKISDACLEGGVHQEGRAPDQALPHEQANGGSWLLLEKGHEGCVGLRSVPASCAMCMFSVG